MIVIIIQPRFANADDLWMGGCRHQSRGVHIGMHIGLVRMNADGRPHVRLARGGGDDVIPFALTRGDVEEGRNASAPRARQHLGLRFDQAFVIQVAVRIGEHIISLIPLTPCGRGSET